MKNCLIVQAHRSSFSDPIILKKGEKVSIGSEYLEDPDWQNWIECKNQRGKKGWVPKQYLKISGNTSIILRDYSAKELDVKIGDEITVYRFQNGWAWSKNSTGEFGWVPLKHIIMKNKRRL